MANITGAQIVAETLRAEGVDWVFGYPGGAVLHIYDALHAQQDVVHILVRHEQAAVHAADGYARATGKVGVALVTSGPGATNAITGLATAYMDSVPLVVISGQVPTPLIGTDAFQEVDMVGISRPVVKHNFLVTNVADIAKNLAEAFYIAESGRPGPVVIDIAKDATAQKCAFHYEKITEMRSYQVPRTVGMNDATAVADLIKNAKRPILYGGGGIILDNAAEPLTEFARYLGCPVTLTLMGLGAFPANDEQFIGMLGMHGTYEANMAMHHCDLLLAVGARFDDRVTGGKLERFCPHAKIVHLDIDPANINKNVAVDIPMVAPIHTSIQAINHALVDYRPNMDAWWAKIKQWQTKNSLAYQTDSARIKPQRVIEEVHRITGGNAFVTADVGQHQMWAAQYYGFNLPRRWINSGGLGTMGFGFPAAMGVKLAYPEADVVCITGDGSIQMMLQELSTCQQYQVPVKIINLNNCYLGMVRQWQEFFYEKRYAMSYMDSLPDFVKLAEAYGHVGIQVKDPAELTEALERAFSMTDRLVFVDVLIDPDENVFPMIPAGGSQDAMILNAAGETSQAEPIT